MNNIDILEEMIKPIATRTFIFPDGRKEEKEIYNLERKQIEAIENLIAENKELKDSNVELATIIDCLQTDLKEIKENSIPKSKLKAKIEEVEQWGLYNMKIPKLSTLDERLGAKIGIKYVLQSLLGKE